MPDPISATKNIRYIAKRRKTMRERSKEIQESDDKYEAELKIKLDHMGISREDWKKYIFWKHCEQEFLDSKLEK